MYAFKHQTSHQTFSSTSETFSYTVHSIAIRHSHTQAKFFSFDSETNCFAAFNGCKTYKMDKNLVFSTFDPRPRLLTLDF